MFNRRKRRLSMLLILALGVGLLINAQNSSAATMLNRKVLLSNYHPSEVSTHTFQFDIPSTSVIGSMVFEYCDNSPSFYEVCSPPSGLDATAGSLSSQSGNTGFSFDSANTTANRIVITRPAAAGSITSNTYVLDNITNPSATSPSIFVKISTYPTANGTGAYSDTGAVAFAVQDLFTIGAFVPPFLQLCVAITVAPDCSTILGDSIDLGILSSTQANAGQSQFATATNDPTGYIIYALGNTMTSGNNTIPSLTLPTASFPGTGQFGINLRANLIPAVGQNPVGTGTAVVEPNYNIPNRFTYNSGDSIASSSLNTDYNRMTVSYLVNRPSNQIPGVYGTTITYVATVQF